MAIGAESLQYFKDLIEGRDVISWHPWWRDNCDRLQQVLGRTEYLKLKFGQVDAAAEQLKNHGIAFEWTPKGRREAVWGRMGNNCVDEAGHPLPKFRKRIYDGAVEAYKNGDAAAGAERLEKVVKKIARIRDEIERSEALNELQFDGEQIYEEGNTAGGLAMLRAVARWETCSDLETPAVKFAQQKLLSVGESW